MSDRTSAVLWISLLTAASIATTLMLACATPFAALAALAAVHLRRRDGIALMVLAWGTGQAIGFGLLGYPRDAGTIGWGLSIGLAALAALFGAERVMRRADGYMTQIALAYVAAFVVFKAMILLCSFGLNGVGLALSPTIMLKGFVRDGAILVGLLALYRGLVTLGVPPAPRLATA